MTRRDDLGGSFILWMWVVVGFSLCGANIAGAVIGGVSVPCADASLCPTGSFTIGRGGFVAFSVESFLLGFLPLADLTGWPVRLFGEAPV